MATFEAKLEKLGELAYQQAVTLHATQAGESPGQSRSESPAILRTEGPLLPQSERACVINKSLRDPAAPADENNQALSALQSCADVGAKQCRRSETKAGVKSRKGGTQRTGNRPVGTDNPKQGHWLTWMSQFAFEEP